MSLISTIVFKCLNNLAPQYISDLISPQTEKMQGTRCNEDYFLLNVPQTPRYTKTNGAFSIAAPRIWNSLPYNIRSSNCIKTFQKALKTHYFTVAFKGSDELYDDIDYIV